MADSAKWLSTILLPPSAIALGRLVGDVSDPNESFQDIFPPDDCPGDSVSTEVAAENFFYNSAAHQHRGFDIALTAALGLTLSLERDRVTAIRAESVTVRRLLNILKHFDDACREPVVRLWLEGQWRRRGKAYMVTSVITLRNAQLHLGHGNALDANGGIGMSGSTALLAATHGAVPTLGGIEDILDSEVAASQGSATGMASGFKFPGEKIMAV